MVKILLLVCLSVSMYAVAGEPAKDPNVTPDVMIIEKAALPDVATDFTPSDPAKGLVIFLHEAKTADGISFSLGKVRFWDIHNQMFLKPYNPKKNNMPYQFKVYKTENKEPKIMAVYAMGSGRFSLWDGITKDGQPIGGRVENATGVIRVVIHYDAKITHIGAVSGGKETRFKLPKPEIIR